MKANKGKKRWRILVALCIVAAVVTGLLWWLPVTLRPLVWPAAPEPMPSDTVLTAEQVQEDREQMIGHVESIHPYFIAEEDHSAYEAAKAEYTAATQGSMTVSDFQTATARYLCFFADGHTKVSWTEEEYLQPCLYYRDGRYYLSREESTVWVEEISGVPVDAVFAAIADLFPAENEMAVAVNRNSRIDGRNLLTLAGAAIENDTVTLKLSDGSETTSVFAAPAPYDGEPVLNTWCMDGDVFVVDFNTCTDDDELKAIAEELEKAVEQGCNKVIIDARGNGGGNSNACDRLLAAMGMKNPRYSMLVRYSPEASQQRGYLRRSGSIHMKTGSVASSRQNEQVQLVVLCDRFTFSSATMLCVYVRDGRLGTLIGEPSSNMPSCYGDVLSYTLTHSHVNGSISHKQFVRPDGANTERMLMPDVLTSSEEAYEAAMTYLGE